MKIEKLSSNYENRLSFYLKDEISKKDFWVEFIGIHKAWITIPNGPRTNDSYSEKDFELKFENHIPKWTKKHIKIEADLKHEVECLYKRILKLKAFI